MLENLLESFKSSAELLNKFYSDLNNIETLVSISKKISDAFNSGHKILIAGNGGSACDAMHFAEEFTGRYRKNRRALPVIPLVESGHITCVANDYGYEEVFSRGVEAYGQKGDWFIGLSTSGHSKNIIKAIEKAKEIKMHVFSLLGKDGGAARGLSEFEFIIPGHTADRIQEVHMTILHVLIEGVERILFPSHYVDEPRALS